MIIGNGLLANTFKNYINNNNIIIFASGVSNSKEINETEFKRELELLKKTLTISKGKKIIYFSTCSISDISLTDSKYINHKNNIEEFIKVNFDCYLIFRLPNIVSNNKNLNTSFNFFKNKLINNELIFCEKYAFRYFIDIDDLEKTIPLFIDSDNFINQTINICFNNKEKVYDFIIKMSTIINLIPQIKLIDKGFDYTIDNTIFIDKLKEVNYILQDDYNNKIIKKYI